MHTPIHWHEGLFLQPHHLQRLQKNITDAVGAERQLSWAYPYGVVEARLSPDELENQRVRFERFRAVMPSGVEIDVPGNADLPSFDIKQALARAGSFYIYLGIPLWFDRRANVIEHGQAVDSRSKLLYHVKETKWSDENTGDNEKPVLVRRLNPRLLLENDDRSDLDVIPLLRITRGIGEDIGTPRQDTRYVPPCLVLRGSPVLREMVRDLASQVSASRQELVVQLTRAGFSLENLRGLQFEQLTRLRTLNRFAGKLPALTEAPNVTPFSLYLELRELLGELAALHPDRDEFEVAPYDHDNPWPCFSELSTKIRSLLKGVGAPSFIRVPFLPVHGLRTATLTAEHFDGPNEYFLGIKTAQDPVTLARLVENPDEFKLMPRSLATRAIRGVPLKEERFVPLELPSQAGLHYFRLTREGSRSWQQIQIEGSAIVVWSGPEADYDIALYMTVPQTDG